MSRNIRPETLKRKSDMTETGMVVLIWYPAKNSAGSMFSAGTGINPQFFPDMQNFLNSE